MIQRKAYRYQLKTNGQHEILFSQFAGCCRFIWNKALDLNKVRLTNTEKILRYNSITLLLPQWKKTFTFLSDAHSQILQQSLKDLDRALMDAFSKTSPKRFPRFKKKGKHDSFRFPQGVKINANTVYLPKIGWVPFRKSREIVGTIKNTTITRQGKKWYVSFQVEIDSLPLKHPSTTMVGVDVGITHFATLSNGIHIHPLNSYKTYQHKLTIEQRILSNKTKFSNNWKKQQEKIRKLHTQISDTRRDFLHKLSTQISKNHAIVVMENLKVSSMSRSARGSVEKPGRNVAAKSGLNRSILDQGWGEFGKMLEYKLNWAGGRLLRVRPHYTSQTCVQCGHIDPKNRNSQAQFECLKCGYGDNADLNAAKNILAAGHAVLACGELADLGLSLNQEPSRRAA